MKEINIQKKPKIVVMKSGATCKRDITVTMPRPETQHGTCTYTDACASAISKRSRMFIALNCHTFAAIDRF